MGRNSYGQLTNDQGEIVYEYGPNAGKTAAQVQGSALTGGAGSSTSYDSASGQSVSTQTPNMIPQETDQQVTLQNNQARLSADAARQKAQLDADAEARRLSNMRSMWTSTGGAAGPAVSGGPAPDETAARGAAFARAKDTAGATALASLKALEDVMAERGLHGSTIEGNETANILGGAVGQLGEQARSQMIGDAQRAAQIADRDYAGAITQRGQNMQQQQSLLSLFGGGVY